MRLRRSSSSSSIGSATSSQAEATTQQIFVKLLSHESELHPISYGARLTNSHPYEHPLRHYDIHPGTTSFSPLVRLPSCHSPRIRWTSSDYHQAVAFNLAAISSRSIVIIISSQRHTVSFNRNVSFASDPAKRHAARDTSDSRRHAAKEAAV